MSQLYVASWLIGAAEVVATECNETMKRVGRLKLLVCHRGSAKASPLLMVISNAGSVMYIGSPRVKRK